MQIDLEKLPHWIRVAFAARCARRVQSLFADAWREATPNRVAAVERAIELAARSAAEHQACDGLDEANREAVMVAGRALFPCYDMRGMGSDEPNPAGREAAVVASLAARVAAKAAESAATAPSSSAQPAMDAFHFAVDAINAASRPGLVEFLEADFEALTDEMK